MQLQLNDEQVAFLISLAEIAQASLGNRILGLNQDILQEIAMHLKERIAEDTDPVHMAFRTEAKGFCCEGDIECDDDAPVSLGDSDGGYVQAWIWVNGSQAGLIRNEDGDWRIMTEAEKEEDAV